MPIQRTFTASDLEKRLKLLSRQLYGTQYPVSSHQQTPGVSDTIYLKKDLTKIAILSSLSIGALLLLYFSQLPSKIKLF